MGIRRQVGLQLPVELVEALDRKAKATGTTRTALIERGAEWVLNGEAGQPLELGTPEPSVTGPNGFPEEKIKERMERLRPHVRMMETRLRDLAIRQLEGERRG